jgi:hypothetical protein
MGQPRPSLGQQIQRGGYGGFQRPGAASWQYSGNPRQGGQYTTTNNPWVNGGQQAQPPAVQPVKPAQGATVTPAVAAQNPFGGNQNPITPVTPVVTSGGGGGTPVVTNNGGGGGGGGGTPTVVQTSSGSVDLSKVTPDQLADQGVPIQKVGGGAWIDTGQGDNITQTFIPDSGYVAPVTPTYTSSGSLDLTGATPQSLADAGVPTQQVDGGAWIDTGQGDNITQTFIPDSGYVAPVTPTYTSSGAITGPLTPESLADAGVPTQAVDGGVWIDVGQGDNITQQFVPNTPVTQPEIQQPAAQPSYAGTPVGSTGVTSLPAGWDGFSGQQKINFFNENGITLDDIAGVTGQPVDQGTIDWMRANGYTVGAAPIGPAQTDWDGYAAAGLDSNFVQGAKDGGLIKRMRDKRKKKAQELHNFMKGGRNGR